MEDMIKAARTGDKNAMEKLVQQYEVKIRLYAGRVAPGPDIAEDIAQTAFITALKSLDKFDPNRDFGLWVCGIVRNLAKTEWRRISRSRARMERFSQHVQLLAEEQADKPDNEEKLNALRKCMKQLPEKSNTLLHMHFELGFKYQDIARQVDLSVDAVKQAMSRMRGKLRVCVEKALGQMQETCS